jgi:CrcB protein
MWVMQGNSLNILAIALGGALGALGRYGTGSLAAGIGAGFFPWGTFIVNMTGAFVIGFLSVFFESFLVPPALRGMLMVGFLGSYTTFSTYMLESVRLLQDREYLIALANLLGGVVLGLFFVVAGLYAGRLSILYLYQGIQR